MRDKFFPDSIVNFEKMLTYIKGKKVAIIGHMRPDGDCISSEYVLAKLFRRCGAKDVVCLNKHEVPYLYKDFVCREKFLDAESFDEDGYEVVTVDCADYNRTSPNILKKFPKVLGCIDHHISNMPYAEINIFEPSSAATAEVIAGCVLDMGLEIDSEMAEVLYMGLMTDTRQFTTSSTNLRSFEIGTELVRRGVNVGEVAKRLYQREKFGRMKLLAFYLSSLTMHFGGKVCIGILPLGVFGKTNSESEDTDGLVDFARNIEGVKVAVLLEEISTGVKGSIRSKSGEILVNEIAGKFGGGGHYAAAGFNVSMGMEEFMPRFMGVLEEYLEK